MSKRSSRMASYIRVVLRLQKALPVVSKARHGHKGYKGHKGLCAVLGVLCCLGILDAQSATQALVEWPFYGGDQGGMKYSPLTQINKTNVSQLELAWEWKSNEQPLPEY